MFFAKRVVLVEGDSELALFNHTLKLHEHFDISEELFNNTTVVSCGGKWTIVPFAKLLNAFQIPFKIIHDCDKKDRNEAELATIAAIDPYRANEKIRQAANGRQIFVVNDTLEHLIWERDRSIPNKDKPIQVWRRARELLEAPDLIPTFPQLRDLFDFVYRW